MAASIVKFHRTVAANLNTLPVRTGNLIFVSDTKQIFLDSLGTRIEYTCIQVFNKEEERLNLLAPIKGFYFVEETAILWRFDTQWVQLTPSNLNEITFGSSIEDFPLEGNDKILYVADDATYKWDSVTKSYVMVANKTEWKTLI